VADTRLASIDASDAGKAADAIAAMSRAMPRETRDAITANLPPVVRAAQANVAGAGGTYPRRSGMVSADRDGVRLNVGSRYPWAKGAEFGANNAWVFGTKMPASRLSRPQFPRWAGRVDEMVTGRAGYIIGKAIRANLARFTDGVADDLTGAYTTRFRSAGLRARG